MRNLYLVAFLFTVINSYSQDIIVKINGETIESKVEEVGGKFIKYHKYSNLKGSVFNIKIIDVAEIRFEDGTVKVYTIIKDNTESLEETKSIVQEYFNKYTYWENSNEKKRYKAVFEDDYMRLIIMNKSGKKGDKGILYDFSTVYRFGQIDKRDKDVTFLNIWVSILVKEKKDLWEKYKLVIRVKGHENAVVLYKSLKKYNKLLLEKTRNDRRTKKS